jgi:hypothetical protein
MKSGSFLPLAFVLAAAVPLAAARAAVVFPLAAAHAETIQLQIPGIAAVPAPEHRDRERCEALESREQQLRARLEHTSYGGERERTEHELRAVHAELDRCNHEGAARAVRESR